MLYTYEHFYHLLRAFNDEMYIRIDGKQLYVIYKTKQLQNAMYVTDFWRELALRNGLKGLHLVAVLQSEVTWDPASLGFDAITISNQTKLLNNFKQCGVPPRWNLTRLPATAYKKMLGYPLHVYSYENALPHFLQDAPS